MASPVVQFDAPSREILLQNEVDDFMRSLAAPRLEITRDTDQSLILTQTTNYDQPASVYAHPLTQEFQPGRSCEDMSTRRRWLWKVTVEWDRQVITDRLIDHVASQGVTVTDFWLRMVDVESPYRPKLDPSKGTILIFTFETLAR